METFIKIQPLQFGGEENYSKAKRKLAKSANFGILYGMTGKNFAERFGMTLEEGDEFVEQFKSRLPTLFAWTERIELLAAKLRNCKYYVR